MKRMKWENLLSAKRFGQENLPPASDDGRSPFEADINRIIFSGAFRRLGRKTQVHPLAANDHVHTRLTHSLEVSQVGRALGNQLGKKLCDNLPADITPSDFGAVVEAACLAHDIGNPPFGHAGEEAMRHWFEMNGPALFGALSDSHKQDVVGFEGNAQGFRIMTQTENHLFSGGMRLTYATLGAFLKYPWNSSNPENKFGAFLSENEVLTEVARELGMIKKDEFRWARHPLAYLVEAADDICYAVLDLEDAVELRILTFEEVKNTLLKAFDEEERIEIEKTFGREEEFRINLARLRGPVFDKAVSGAIEGFMNGYEQIMCGNFEGNVYEALEDGDLRKGMICAAKDLAKRVIFSDPRKVEIELGSYSTFDALLSAFCRAAVDMAEHLGSPDGETTLSWKSGLVMKLLSDHAPTLANQPPQLTWSQYQCLRRVIDYVSGMTDNYAIYVAKQLQGGGFAGAQRP